MNDGIGFASAAPCGAGDAITMAAATPLVWLGLGVADWAGAVVVAVGVGLAVGGGVDGGVGLSDGVGVGVGRGVGKGVGLGSVGVGKGVGQDSQRQTTVRCERLHAGEAVQAALGP